MASVLEKQYGKYSLQEIRDAKKEFYINSDNTAWRTIEKKYLKMIDTASDYKRPQLERAYNILKEHYEGNSRISKEEREGLRGHPKQKQEFPAQRNIQKSILTGLARKAKTQQLQDWRKIYQPAGPGGFVVEYSIPYETRKYRYYDKSRDKAERKKEGGMKYARMKAEANARARRETGSATKKERLKKYVNPQNPKKRQGWRKPRTKTPKAMIKKYNTNAQYY